jgi:tRNA threonylcarbamoyladenosine biosynthesis protein TsaB
MRILGIDTATTTASVALIENGQLVVEKLYDRTRAGTARAMTQPQGNHAEIILPLIRSAFDHARVDLTDLSGVALSIGPGSFTGLRIALATVKGIAYEWGLPVVGVSTLHANAARVTDADDLVCSLLDARKQEVYAALFRRDNGALTRLSEDSLLAVGAVIELILAAHPRATTVIVGDGVRAYRELLASALGSTTRFSTGDEYGSVAAQVAEIAMERFCAASTDDLGPLVPCYLRPSEAQSKSTGSALTC